MQGLSLDIFLRYLILKWQDNKTGACVLMNQCIDDKLHVLELFTTSLRVNKDRYISLQRQ